MTFDRSQKAAANSGVNLMRQGQQCEQQAHIGMAWARHSNRACRGHGHDAQLWVSPKGRLLLESPPSQIYRPMIDVCDCRKSLARMKIATQQVLYQSHQRDPTIAINPKNPPRTPPTMGATLVPDPCEALLCKLGFGTAEGA